MTAMKHSPLSHKGTEIFRLPSLRSLRRFAV